MAIAATEVVTEPPRFRFNLRKVWWSLDRTKSADLWDEMGEAARAEGIARFRFAGDTCWIVTEPTWVRQALTSPPDVVSRSTTFRKMSVVLGEGLLTTEGPAHRLRRRQMQPAFHRDRFTAYAASIVEAAKATDAEWRAGARILMDRDMAALTIDAIGRAVLGVDGRALAPTVGRALERLMRAMPLMFVPKADYLAGKPIPGLGWLREAIATLDRIARNSAATSEAELVKSLRVAAEDLPQLSEEDVRDELLTLLMAGHETTAVTLTWLWWLLDQHPDVGDRLAAEITAVISDRDPVYEDVERLHFAQAVVAETLRIRPAAWINEREVVGPLQFGPYRPQPGDLLMIPSWIVQRDPRWWVEPQVFRPDRWLDRDGRYDEKAPGQPRGAYLPFGAGAHACIGQAFALTEAVLALAVLVPRWRPTLAPDAEVGIRASVTLRPAHGMPMVLAARD
ncbi:MAG TPA: cytochrome P450 [Mycobacteriales bacterium]|jgi:cytochrome P450|nr:cytochrome P450 [Mycobacteriales bacterium]